MEIGLVLSAFFYPYGLLMTDSDTKIDNTLRYGTKEFTADNGLNIYDFGARTYAPDIARFWQPDPMAHNYHWVSPYAYCGSDPINRIDPDGCDWYVLGLNGKIISRIPNEKDALLIQNAEGRIVTSAEYASGTLNVETASASNGIDHITTISLVGNDIGTEIFEMLASNTNVEWSLIQADDLSNGIKEQNYIGTSHNRSKSHSIDYHLRAFINPSTHDVFDIIHSHPDNTAAPSGFDSEAGDIWNAKKYGKIYPHALFSIFIPNTGQYIFYTGHSKKEDFNYNGGPLNNINVYYKR